jgi:endonuclease YncB( thermonuclease family)
MPSRGQMTDEQRKAMWAKRGGGGGGGHSGGFGKKKEGPAYTQRPDGTLDFGPDDMSWMDREAKGISTADSDFLQLGFAKMGSGLATLAKEWGIPAGLAYASGAIGDYREANATMDPRLEKGLAIGQQLTGYLAAITGLKSAKRGLTKGLNKYELEIVAGGNTTTLPLTKALGKGLGSVGDYLAGKAGAAWQKVPGAISGVLEKAYKGYTAIADKTGVSLTDITPKNYKAALAALSVFTGHQVYEEKRIAGARKDVAESWDKGEGFDIRSEDKRSGLGQVAWTAAGTLGNPVERQGRFGIQGLTDQTAAYREGYDRIRAAEKSGKLTKQEAEAQLATWAAKNKPFNMAGKSLYTLAPASAAYLAWKGRELGDFITSERKYLTIDSDRKKKAVRERDADTFEATTGEKIRYLGTDSTETAHSASDKDEPYAREATDFVKRLAPDGSVVRVMPGSPVGFEVDDTPSARTLGYVEKLRGPNWLTKGVAQVPGLRAVWPGVDVNEATIAAGLGQPRYEEKGSAHDRRRKYHDAALSAIEKQKGIWSPEGREALKSQGLYQWQPAPGEKRQTFEDKLMTQLGSGLMYTGQSGAFSATKKLGTGLAQTWNAALAVGGARQFQRQADTAKEKKPFSRTAPKLPTEADRAWADYQAKKKQK